MRPLTHNGYILRLLPDEDTFPPSRSNEITAQFYFQSGALANDRNMKIVRTLNGREGRTSYHRITNY